MKTLTNFAELDEYLKLDYRHIRLVNSKGQTLITFNPPSSKVEERKNKIIKYLESDLTPAGVYFIDFATSHKKNKATERISYTKGIVPQAEITTIIEKSNLTEMEKDQDKENFLSYSAALEYERRLAKFDYDVKILTAENDELKATVKELEDEFEAIPDDEPKNLQEQPPVNTFAWLETLIPTFKGIAETHFDLKKKQLEIEEMKMRSASHQPAADQADNDTNLLLRYFMQLKTESPEMYQQAINEIKNPKQTTDESAN